MLPKKLNHVRSMNYLNLISIRHALIYVHSYFATGFHRIRATCSFAKINYANIAPLALQMKRCEYAQISSGNCNPTTGLYGGYIWPQGEFVNENVTNDTGNFRFIG
jgi:hypothetical protein